MIARAPSRSGRLGGLTVGALALITTVIAFTVTIGADAMWLVALGNDIATKGSVPAGIPFADNTNRWVNVPVLGECLLAAVDRLGPWGLLSAQVMAVAITITLLAKAAMRLGATDAPTATAVLLFAIGSLAALGVVRVQLFSLPLFAALLLLLRAEHERPSGRIWLVVPLIGLWGNLHGAVLVGVAAAGSYLLLSRLRLEPGTTTAVLLVMLTSLWWTPALLRSPQYYLDVLANEAATRHEGLWARVSLHAPLDLLLVLAGVCLLTAALCRRLPVWEYVATAGLVLMTAQAARHGVWLLAFLAPRAAVALTRPNAAGRGWAAPHPVAPGWQRRVIGSLSIVGLLVAWTLGISQRVPSVKQSGHIADQIAQVIGPARTTLAPSPLAEYLANSKVTLYAGNPLDAFPAYRQRAYLDFLSSPDIAVSLRPVLGAVVVAEATPTPALDRTFPEVRHVAGYRIYLSASLTGIHRA